MPNPNLDYADFKASWMLADQAEATVVEYISHLRKYHAWCDSRTPTMQTARAYLAELKETSRWGAYMASRALKAWGRWWAEEYGEDDPYARLKYVKQPEATAQKTATVEDVEKLLASIEEKTITDLRDKALIHVLACTGMRRSEISRMKWQDLSLESGTIHIPKTKNGHARTARLSQAARRAVKRYLRALDHWEADNNRHEVEWVWPSMSSRSGPLLPNGITQMIGRRAKTANVEVSVHAFRRGFAMRWLRHGGSETYLREAAGWKDTRMVARYVSAVAQEEALREHERIFG